MASNKGTKQAIFVGFLGNVVEWYDFSIYAYLAYVLSNVFFGAKDRKIALLEVFLVFSLSYLIRPIGSIYFGYIGDKIGRSTALKISLFLMAIPTIFIGILPSYNKIGVLSTILLIILRAIQGFAAGGELPCSACYLYETSPKNKRNFHCSFVAASSMLGVLFGSLIVSILVMIFPEDIMRSWGWRIPFLLGFPIFIFIYYVRKNLEETKSFKNVESKENLLLNVVKCRIAIIQIFSLYAFISISFYLLFVWMPSYLKVFLEISSNIVFISNTIGLFALIIFTLLFGFTAERIGMKKLIIFSIFSIAVLTYPMFLWLTSTKGIYAIIFIPIIFAICLGCIDGVIMSTMGNLFSTNIRCTGISVSFTFANAIFGGTAPTMCSYLINKTGNNLSPVFFLITACLIALPVALGLKDTTFISKDYAEDDIFSA